MDQQTLTEDELREEVSSMVREHVTLSHFCNRHGLSRTCLSNFLTRRRAAPHDLLNMLGYQKVNVYVKETTK